MTTSPSSPTHQVEDENRFQKGRDGKVAKLRSWAANPELFPCQLSDEALAQATKAVQAAVASWGERKWVKGAWGRGQMALYGRAGVGDALDGYQVLTPRSIMR